MTRPSWRLQQVGTSKLYSYACPICRCSRLRALRNTPSLQHNSNFAASASIVNLESVLPYRQYSTSRCLKAAAVEGGDNLSDIKYNFSVKSGSRWPSKSKIPGSKSQIRDSLRAWGSQNEAIAKRNAPDAIGAEGRIRQLPNALFASKGGQDTDLERHSERSNAGMVNEDAIESSAIIQPGTLIWYAGYGVGQYAVYVGNMGVQSLLALESGSWAVDNINSLRKAAFDDRRLRIPSFLAPNELEPLRSYMPKSRIARPITGGDAISEIAMKGLMPPELIESFLAKMHEFRQTVDDHARKFADEYERGYARVASEHDYRSMNMIEFLSEGFDLDWNASTSAEKMAITQHLADQDVVTTYQTAEEMSVLIMSKKMRKEFEQVVAWARQYQDTASQAAIGRDVTTLLSQNPLTDFIDKARKLILLSRKRRSPTVNGGLGPYSMTKASSEARLEKVRTGVEFSRTDQMFIDFMWTMCFRLPTGMLRGPLRLLPVTSLILRAVGAYPDLTLDHPIARLFLKEIGCADPWSPRTRDMALPLQKGKASHKTDALHRELAAYEVQMENVIANGAFADIDSIAHLRKSWTIPAFAIDREESKMYEDAISIEPAEELEGAYWVHVHVTHVTAWCEPGSIVDRFARNQGASFLSIDGSVRSNMLPGLLTKHFSVTKGSPVLTISTLIAADGTSVDVKVAPGTLDNLVVIPRKAVHKILEIEDSSAEDLSTLSVGEMARSQPVIPVTINMDLAEKYEGDLKCLSKVLQRRLNKRVEELPETVSIPYYTFEADVQTTFSEELDNQRERISYHWEGDPGITLTARHPVRRETNLRRSTEPVAQAMRLAAESLARWLDARHIPAIFMGTEPVSDNTFEQIADKKSYERFLMPLFMRSSTPMPYWNYHLKSFCSCTSPLRRYIDLLALWQVDSYLKAEAIGTVEPGDPVQDQDILSFTKNQIDEYLRFDAHAMDTVDHTLRRVKETYMFQALFRAFHFKEAPLPAQWEVLIREPAKLSAGLHEKNAVGSLVPFGSLCEILPDSSGWAKMAEPGHFLPVNITNIDPESLIVRCTANGAPQNEQTLLQAFTAVSNDGVNTMR